MHRIITEAGDLPDLRNATNVFCDYETTSGDPKLDALNPWHHCDVAGVALTVDDCEDIFYAPVGHAVGRNLPRHAVASWLQDIMSTSIRWVNHHVKYDMHVQKNCMGVDPPGKVRCTIASAKVLDCDRIFKGGYGLDALCKSWLGKIDDGKQTLRLAPYLVKNKDYGRIPIDILGEYACQDVNLNRELDAYLEENIPEQCHTVHETEQALTLALFDMEQRGMHVNVTELQQAELIIMTKLLMLEEQICTMTDMSIRPHVNDDCFDLLCNKYGLPVLAWNDEEDSAGKHRPSFDKDALKSYLQYPGAPVDVIKLMLEYRTLNVLNSLFITQYQKLQTDGVLHPSYNQSIRTFRMSCSKPNAQQLSPEAKMFVHPEPGRAFVSLDQSQIEFRLIAHYIKNPFAIEAYAKDVNTDFHEWVAGMCGIHRKPAKSVNFCLAADELVKTEYGLRTIRWVAENYPRVVSSHEDMLQFAPVVNGGSIGMKPVLKVTMATGESIRCTYDHGLMRVGGNRVNACDLKPGDVLKCVSADIRLAEPKKSELLLVVSDAIVAKFYRGFKQTSPQDCWLWQGKVRTVRVGDEAWKVSRLAWAIANNADPGDLKVCHDCDEPFCVNPRHLWLGTQTDNMLDMYAKGRGVPRSAALTELDLQFIKQELADGTSQYEIAECLGIAQNVVSQLKRGLHTIQRDQIDTDRRVHCVASVVDAGEAECYSVSVDGWHTYVSACGLVNFNCMGFGGGKKRVLSMLATNVDLVGNLGTLIDDLIANGKATEGQRTSLFDMLAQRRAEQVYDTYHRQLPELKQMSRNVANVFTQRGYVYNAHGRRLYGPAQHSFKAFNKVIQSEAAEVIKERTVALAPRYCEIVRERDGHIVASVHDETLFDFPEEVIKDKAFLRQLRDEMINTNVKYRVPLQSTVGVSTKTWCEASKSGTVTYVDEE
jgi:DNA polymerase I-like protein with 3'-5' exonuclease and polymerase domains